MHSYCMQSTHILLFLELCLSHMKLELIFSEMVKQYMKIRNGDKNHEILKTYVARVMIQMVKHRQVLDVQGLWFVPFLWSPEMVGSGRLW